VSNRALRLSAILAAVVLVAGIAGSLALGFAANSLVVSAAPAIATWGGVGAALALLRPRNAVGWLLLAIGVVLSASDAAGAYVDWSKAHPHELPLAAWAAWVASNAWIVVIAFLIPRFLLVFPDGRPPSRRWRIVALAQYAVLAALAVAAAKPGPLPDQDYKRYDNPVGIGALGWLDDIPGWATVIALPILLLATFGSAASLIARFRSSRGIERQQLKWMAWAVGVTAVAWVGESLIPGGLLRNAVEFVSLVGLTLAPLVILVAVLRYRLYDIDAVISKTLVYGSLTLVLGAAYVGLVLAGQALFSSFAGGSNLAVAVSTLLVAALFLPVRSRVQRFVDRRFYRRRYDAQRTLEGFGARLREQVELDDLTSGLRSVVTETMQPAYVALWLRRGGADL
jgi:hypothetical protein